MKKNDAENLPLKWLGKTDLLIQGATVGNTSLGNSRPSGAAVLQGESLAIHKALENRVHTIQNEVGDKRNSMLELSREIRNLANIATNQNFPHNPTDGINNVQIVPPPITRNGSSISSDRVSVNQGERTSHNGSLARSNLDREKLKIRIDKLGLILYRLEHYQRQYYIPWEEIIRDFPLIVTGPAESWYWLFQKTHANHDWDELKHCVLSQYQSSRSNFKILTDLVQRKQQGQIGPIYFGVRYDQNKTYRISHSSLIC